MSSVFGKPRAGSGPQSTPLEVNLAILGRRGAGKSALTVKFLTKRFISEYDPNLEDTYSSEETVDHQPVHLRVMDTADLDTPRNCERYLNWAHAFLVVYSVDSRQSFDSSGSYLELLALHAKETQRSVPALLLGNKLDMAQYSDCAIILGSEQWDSSAVGQEDAASGISPPRPQGPPRLSPLLDIRPTQEPVFFFLPPRFPWLSGKSPRQRVWLWQAGLGACFSRSLPVWTLSTCSTSSMRQCERHGGSWRRAP
ncbi:ras-like protein family member 12 isoform X2 [Macaca nemestrina]|uniref:ras-like protein family member 12 isoform X2 n=1 Tax=Macaca nemestrina TaxID=9545 RepID=UPI0039B8674C